MRKLILGAAIAALAAAPAIVIGKRCGRPSRRRRIAGSR